MSLINDALREAFDAGRDQGNEEAVAADWGKSGPDRTADGAFLDLTDPAMASVYPAIAKLGAVNLALEQAYALCAQISMTAGRPDLYPTSADWMGRAAQEACVYLESALNAIEAELARRAQKEPGNV